MAQANTQLSELADTDVLPHMLTSQALELENQVKILPSQPQAAFIQFLKTTSRVATLTVILVLILSALTLSWYILTGVQAGLYEFKFGLPHFILFTVVTSLVIGLSIWSSVYLRDLHRNHVEKALKESEERYRLVVEGSNEGIWDWDILKNETYWNHRFFHILGIMPTEEMSIQGVFGERLHPEDKERVLEALKNHLEHRTPYEVELRLLNAAGEYRHCFSRGKALFDEHSNPVRMSGMLIDLTDHKQLEWQLALAKEQAERTNHRKDHWISNISQELVMTLNQIIGYSHMLQSATYGELNTKQEQVANHIVTSSQQLLSTVSGLLNISKIEIGEVEIKPEPILIASFIKELESLVREFALARKINLQFDIQPDLTGLHADPESLKQILYNLLSNGIKFNKVGGIVSLRILKSADTQWTIFQVEDTGSGIPQSQIPDLFQEFYKKDTMTKQSVEGSIPGLGLIFTRKLIDLHGGTISVESTEGVGSIFTFKLPS